CAHRLGLRGWLVGVSGLARRPQVLLLVAGTVLLAACAAGSGDAAPTSGHLLPNLSGVTCKDWNGLSPDDKSANAQALNDKVVHIGDLGGGGGPRSGLPRPTPVTLTADQRKTVVAAADSLCAGRNADELLVAGSLAEDQAAGKVHLPGWPST